MLSLCVGAGHKLEGDVNVDVQRLEGVNVVCDAHHLPFQDNLFSVVYIRHCLEHTAFPPVVLAELNRVAYGIVRIWVPSPFIDSGGKEHLYCWNPRELRNLCKRTFEFAAASYTSRLYRGANRKTFLLNILSRLLHVNTEVEAVCI